MHIDTPKLEQFLKWCLDRGKTAILVGLDLFADIPASQLNSLSNLFSFIYREKGHPSLAGSSYCLYTREISLEEGLDIFHINAHGHCASKSKLRIYSTKFV